MKNCGQTVHDEVASKQTMEELKDLLKVAFLLIYSPNTFASLIFHKLYKLHES